MQRTAGVALLCAKVVAAWDLPRGVTEAWSGKAAIVAVLCMALSLKPVMLAARQTWAFAVSLGKSKQRLDKSRIDGYNNLQDDSTTSVKERETKYASLVDAYYDLATEFYEWGWGECFHFTDFRKGESFQSALRRHEWYLSGRLCANKGAKILDCGCGIGGPARHIARFTGAHVTGLTINQFQVNRGNAYSKKEGMQGKVVLVQGDFMKMPFPDNSFDGVYAIEATCHAPIREGVYGEILRVLKPGGIFATYEWCLTDKYDESNSFHVQIKKDIETGDGLPDLCHHSKCTKALGDVGFDVLEVRDCALDDNIGGKPWYYPMCPTWNPLRWPGFQFNSVLVWLSPYMIWAFELIRLVPQGTAKTQVMLQAGGLGCAYGGETGVFTPMWLMVGRKPTQS